MYIVERKKEKRKKDFKSKKERNGMYLCGL